MVTSSRNVQSSQITNFDPYAAAQETFEPLSKATDKKYSKVVTNPKTGRKKTVRYGAKGYTIAPGTSRGDSYCARSAGQMSDHPGAANDPNSPLRLSRKKWKCKGKKSMKKGDTEGLDKSEEPLAGACWKGYEAVGFKTKNGRRVPNCVPMSKTALMIAGVPYIPAVEQGQIVLMKAVKTTLNHGDKRTSEDGRKWIFNGETRRWRRDREGEESVKPKKATKPKPMEKPVAEVKPKPESQSLKPKKMKGRDAPDSNASRVNLSSESIAQLKTSYKMGDKEPGDYRSLYHDEIEAKTAKPNPELVEAFKSKNTNWNPAIVTETGEDQYKAIGGRSESVVASARAAGENARLYSVIIPNDKKYVEVAEALQVPDKKPFNYSDEGRDSHLFLSYLDEIKSTGKGHNAPASEVEAAAKLLLKNNVPIPVPILIRSTGEDSYEVVGNHFAYDVAKKAGLEKAWTIEVPQESAEAKLQPKPKKERAKSASENESAKDAQIKELKTKITELQGHAARLSTKSDSDLDLMLKDLVYKRGVGSDEIFEHPEAMENESDGTGRDDWAYFESVLKRRYRNLSKRYHPDNGGSAEQMNNLAHAYQIARTFVKQNGGIGK